MSLSSFASSAGRGLLILRQTNILSSSSSRLRLLHHGSSSRTLATATGGGGVDVDTTTTAATSTTTNAKREKRGHVHKDYHHKNGPRGVPPISICMQDMDDQTLVTLASIENHTAREEVLRRHIMDVDNVPYADACRTFATIEVINKKGHYLVALPYKIGIFSATFVGIAAIPMVFHLPTIEWFNVWAVTTDVPEMKDLETPLEVSIWSWNWMEPPLGLASFVLLCMQYVRGQMLNLGMKPYTGWIKAYRGQKLANAFPQYEEKILIAYSETANFM
mmetsp:Transcript_6211/g.13402  ORF Transcript_6211/g.13402 Transcript_6211/m.13402 type:complete len:276 (+) Transcript_6211:103-930(+)